MGSSFFDDDQMLGDSGVHIELRVTCAATHNILEPYHEGNMSYRDTNTPAATNSLDTVGFVPQGTFTDRRDNIEVVTGVTPAPSLYFAENPTSLFWIDRRRGGVADSRRNPSTALRPGSADLL